MGSVIQDYLTKRTFPRHWSLTSPQAIPQIKGVVVIPALAEREVLFNTIEALAASEQPVTAQTLVLVVVNNRPPPHASQAHIANNQETLEALRRHQRARRYASLSLSWVDASSPGQELPPGEGVGLARKIGADHGLRLLLEHGQALGPLVHLDADAPPAPGYLDALFAFYEAEPRHGAYAAYRHPITEADTPEMRAIIAYETYMRYHELSLRWAHSPYAYPALGSIISSTATAYAAAGGMNRRLAGEDFYFMQQLVKTGRLEAIPTACVYPSGRQSQRTPFGTGRTVSAHATTSASQDTLYHPESYAVLRRWLALIHDIEDVSGPLLGEYARRIHPVLCAFLEERGFLQTWEKIVANNPDPVRRRQQFHVCFDGLRTIQLIHHLRDNAYPDLAAHEAIKTLLHHLATAPTLEDDPRRTLDLLRRLCDMKPTTPPVKSQ